MALDGPHSGYHWRGQTNRFFEGWYFRLTLPQVAETFAFMYSIDDPAGGGDHSGGAAQILGPGEAYHCRTFPNVTQFWAWPHRLGLGHWRAATAVRPGYLTSEAFSQQVQEGYQVGEGHHQGRLLDPRGEVVAAWDYQVEPMTAWGTPTAQATAGWLSYLPVFEPGWQVLMSHGWASGWVSWYGQHYAFEQAPAYAEKNWGGAFPVKWFWLQCNAFPEYPGLSITAVGGVRDVLTWQEDVGLIGIHYQGELYEFISYKTRFAWEVAPWGDWQLTAQDYRYRVVVTGRTADAGARVRVPTQDGLKWLCHDTTHGELRVQLWSVDGRVILDAVSHLAGLEVGGGPWDERWVVAS